MAKSQDLNPLDRPREAQTSLLDDEPQLTQLDPTEKNLSFLLDAAIYHPLGQVDVPPPFRKPLLPPPQQGTSITQAFAQLESLISRCDFLGAAHFAALCLTSGIVQAIDYTSIFKLLAIRYSCLELLGQVLLAAQESKALEDLSSEFYYIITDSADREVKEVDETNILHQHIMPFSLRVQALRLQSIGFSDPRRGITALYDLGLEVREHISSPSTTPAEKYEWSERLELIGIHVINSLIELGDLDCAQRTLAQSKPPDPRRYAHWAARMILLHLRLGQISRAKDLAKSAQLDEGVANLLISVVAIADGQLEEAADLLVKYGETNDEDGLTALARQDLAVAYLYLGKIEGASKLLEGLIQDGYSFHTLTVNLATIYDLTSDRSVSLKQGLAIKLANSQNRVKAFTNADFKL